MQFISHGHLSSLKVSFKIDLGLLDFNMVSELSFGFWANLPVVLMITMTLNCSLMIFSYELMIYVLKLNFDYWFN